jgi:hypothetical protein
MSARSPRASVRTDRDFSVQTQRARRPSYIALVQKSLEWWESLTVDQRDAVLAMPHGHLEPWVLETMEAAGIVLVSAVVDSVPVRLPSVVTTDFIEGKRKR